ncbi:Cof-type HAD-IIB family hydrolase [Treponema pectinovorum]|uniref:Cof-type HAD-IIB family hydrolase n=1 Tax=Treponema pectinovorum TaxID=164 RepID=UPI0011F3AA17|nr:Cof-type HAD-IIB family hydrolase [Treponema pectinovorum]
MENTQTSKLPVKLIAFDLDDTLLNDKTDISPKTLKAVQSCSKKGIYIVLCSGRVENAILPYVRKLDIAGSEFGRYIIAINGAEIFDLHTRLPIFEKKLDGKILKEVHSYCSSFDLGSHVCDSDTVYADRDTSWTRKDSQMCGLKFLKVEDFDSFMEKGHPKMLIPAPEEKIAEFMPFLKEKLKGRAEVFTSKPYFLEVMPLGCGKGQSILELAKILNIPKENTMGFGDSFNDESMIRLTGYGVAMKNGAREIQSIAKFVTEFDNNNDGIAAFLEKWVL